MNQKDIDTLRRIRNVVSSSWTRGTYKYTGYSGHESYCLVGAVNKETGTYIWRPSPFHRKGQNTLSTIILRLVGALGFSLFNGTRRRILKEIRKKIPAGFDIEGWNDDRYTARCEVLGLLDQIIEENQPKAMEIGKPDKQYTIEPAEPIPGIKESPAPAPEPVKEPVPEREKVPA